MPFSDTRGFVLSAAACAVVLALSGCGGGGGGASTTPPPGRSMAQLDPEPVALPEGVTLARAGTFTIEPGESVDRDGARFTCAAGGPACAVVVVERAGGGYAATATGGEVRVAAAQVPAPPVGGGQPGGMEEDGLPFPDWPVADAAAARSLVGGSALSWSPSDIHSRVAAMSPIIGPGSRGDFLDPHPRCAPYIGSGRLQRGGYETGGFGGDCDATEYRSVMTYGGIPIVEARVVGLHGGVGSTTLDYEETAIVGILDHGYFMAARGEYDDRLERDDVRGAVFLNSRDAMSVRGSFRDPDYLMPTGRWRGALVGTGTAKSSPLYNQFIIGDVDITLGGLPSRRSEFYYGDINVEFSNVRNINTGTAVTLSRTRWNFEKGEDHPAGNNWGVWQYVGEGGPLVEERQWMKLRFVGAAGNEEAFGWFHLPDEAVGAFGVKKQ